MVRLNAAVFAFVLLIAFAVPSATWAHSLQVQPVEVVIRPCAEYLNVEFSGNIQDITQGISVADSERSGDHFTPSAEKRTEKYINEHFVLRQGEQTLTGKLFSLNYESGLDPTQAKYRMTLRYPRDPETTAKSGGKEQAYTITSTLFDYLPNALTLLNVGGLQRNLESGQTVTVDPSALVSNVLQNVTDLCKLGMEHIFTGPDHMLFILALLLVSPTLKSLIKTLTGFTIAHSVTLILSTLSVVSLPAKMVDIFVALSIIYVGAENILRKDPRHRFWIASGFGLIHGFAFATNLRDAGLPEGSALFLSLLSFNIGVETAQVLICCAAFPLLMIWKRGTEQRAKYGGMPWQNVINIVSGGVVAAGAYWLIQRAFGT